MDEADESRRIVRALSDRALRSGTPPDSGEREMHQEWCALVTNQQAEKCDCILRRNTKDPESREFWEFCDRTAAAVNTPSVSVPLPLAQRILAALEDAWDYAIVADQLEIRAILDELRAAVERKT